LQLYFILISKLGCSLRNLWGCFFGHFQFYFEPSLETRYQNCSSFSSQCNYVFSCQLFYYVIFMIPEISKVSSHPFVFSWLLFMFTFFTTFIYFSDLLVILSSSGAMLVFFEASISLLVLVLNLHRQMIHSNYLK
jgi:hypothetical protein